MGQLLRIRNNFLFLSAAEVIAKLVGATLYVLLARYLGPGDFGMYSLAASFGLIFGLLSGLGLDALLVKDLAREPRLTQTYFSHSFLLRAAAGFLSFLALGAIVFIVGYEEKPRWVILIFGLSLFVTPIVGLLSAVFKAHQQMQYPALMSSLRPVVNCLLAVLMMGFGLGVTWIAGIHLLTGLAIFLLFYLLVLRRHFCRLRWPESPWLAVTLLKSGWPFLLTGIVYILNTKIDIVMLSKLVGLEAVGLYSAANEIIAILLVVPSLASTVLFPVFSKEIVDQEEKAISKARLAARGLNHVGIAGGLILILLARDIVVFVYGQEFIGSVPVMQILGAGLCVVFSRSILGWLLTAMDKVKLVMLINVGALGANVLLNLMLVPILGYPGAAVATVCATVLGFFVIWGCLGGRVRGLHIVNSYAKPFVCGIGMSAVVVTLTGVHVVPKIGIAVLVYVVLALTLAACDQEERALIRRSFAMRVR